MSLYKYGKHNTNLTDQMIHLKKVFEKKEIRNISRLRHFSNYQFSIIYLLIQQWHENKVLVVDNRLAIIFFKNKAAIIDNE